MNLKDKLLLSDHQINDLFSPLVDINRMALAVSGGRDSLALMFLINKWLKNNKFKKDIVVLTVNHQLREESNAECAEVSLIAEGYGFHHKILIWHHGNIKTSIQEKARNARYELMINYLKETRIDTLITGHTLDDNIETFLMRLAKGSGLEGLKSIQTSRNLDGINLFRPLLKVTRDQTTKILVSQNIGWIDDPTNNDEKYERIKIRNNISTLEKLNISKEKLQLTLNRLGRAHEVISNVTDKALREVLHFDNLGYVSLDYDILRAYPHEIIIKVFEKALIYVNGKRVSLQSLERVCSEVIQTRKPKTINGCVIYTKKNMIHITRENRDIECFNLKVGDYHFWDNRFKICLKSFNEDFITIKNLGRSKELKYLCENTIYANIPMYVLNTLPGGFIKDKLVLMPNIHNIYNSGYLDVKFKLQEKNKLV
jgi:tRNA(Ile)-lysidine synthase